MHQFVKFVLCVILLLLSVKSFSQTGHNLTDATKVYRVDTWAEVFVDKSNKVPFDSIITEEYQEKFGNAGSNLTFGYIDAAIWLKLRVKSTLSGIQWYLDIPSAYLEYVDFYQSQGGNYQHSVSGYYRPHKLRDVHHTGHVLALHFKKDTETVVYIRIAGASTKTFPLFIREKEKFIHDARAEDIGYGVFFGILFVMFFYNLFIYLILRQANYLIYICTILCTFFIFASASGYAAMYLWPETPQLNYYAGRLSLPIQGIIVACFTIRFLELRKYSPTMYYVVLALIPLSVLSFLLLVTGTLSSAGNNLISIATVVYMVAGIVARIKGNHYANYFIAAWAIYLTGGLLLTLRNNGLFAYNVWTTHFVEVGAALETIIIAFALAERYRRLRIEKEEAQREALQLQQATTGELEELVRDRTERLSKAFEELTGTLETNRLQTEIIEEKNAELDAFFYRVSHDLKGPISTLRGLLMLARIDVQDATAREYIEKQFRQVERLDLIISGLINLTKLNKSELETSQIDFHKVVDECIQSFQTLPSFRKISITKTIEEGLSCQSEWTLINAIIQNLLENAIKYARGDDPFVRIRIYGDGQMAVIEVEDNGSGIEPEHHPRIFDMFYRANRDVSGTGLGLYILKRSVDRLKGTIELRSQPGAGTTFTVRLPRQSSR